MNLWEFLPYPLEYLPEDTVVNKNFYRIIYHCLKPYKKDKNKKLPV